MYVDVWQCAVQRMPEAVRGGEDVHNHRCSLPCTALHCDTQPCTATHSPALREAAGGDLFVLQLDVVHVPREDEFACAGYARRAYVSHNQSSMNQIWEERENSTARIVLTVARISIEATENSVCEGGDGWTDGRMEPWNGVCRRAHTGHLVIEGVAIERPVVGGSHREPRARCSPCIAATSDARNPPPTRTYTNVQEVDMTHEHETATTWHVSMKQEALVAVAEEEGSTGQGSTQPGMHRRPLTCIVGDAIQIQRMHSSVVLGVCLIVEN